MILRDGPEHPAFLWWVGWSVRVRFWDSGGGREAVLLRRIRGQFTQMIFIDIT